MWGKCECNAVHVPIFSSSAINCKAEELVAHNVNDDLNNFLFSQKECRTLKFHINPFFYSTDSNKMRCRCDDAHPKKHNNGKGFKYACWWYDLFFSSYSSHTNHYPSVHSSKHLCKTYDMVACKKWEKWIPFPFSILTAFIGMWTHNFSWDLIFSKGIF